MVNYKIYWNLLCWLDLLWTELFHHNFGVSIQICFHPRVMHANFLAYNLNDTSLYSWLCKNGCWTLDILVKSIELDKIIIKKENKNALNKTPRVFFGELLTWDWLSSAMRLVKKLTKTVWNECPRRYYRYFGILCFVETSSLDLFTSQLLFQPVRR